MLHVPMMIAVILCILVEIPLFILLPIMIKFAFSKSGWHLYYKTIFLMLLLTIASYVLSTFLVDMLLLCMERIPNKRDKEFQEKLYFVCTDAQVYTSAFIRSCNWVLVIERITSTLKRKVYEQYHSYFVTISICIVIIAYGVVVKNISQVWDEFDAQYYKFSIAFDFVTIIISLYLWYINKKLRRLTIASTKDLSEKFQLNENIRLVKLTFPFIVSYILINTTFNLLLDFGYLLIPDTDLVLAYNDLCVFVAYIIIFIYVLKENGIIKKFVYHNTGNTVSLRKNAKNNEISHNNLQTIKINGKVIPTNYNDEAYLRVVTKAW